MATFRLSGVRRAVTALDRIQFTSPPFGLHLTKPPAAASSAFGWPTFSGSNQPPSPDNTHFRHDSTALKEGRPRREASLGRLERLECPGSKVYGAKRGIQTASRPFRRAPVIYTAGPREPLRHAWIAATRVVTSPSNTRTKVQL